MFTGQRFPEQKFTFSIHIKKISSLLLLHFVLCFLMLVYYFDIYRLHMKVLQISLLNKYFCCNLIMWALPSAVGSHAPAGRMLHGEQQCHVVMETTAALHHRRGRVHPGAGRRWRRPLQGTFAHFIRKQINTVKPFASQTSGTYGGASSFFALNLVCQCQNNFGIIQNIF